MKKILTCSIALASLALAGSAFGQACTPSAGTPALNGTNSNTTTGAYDTCSATNQLSFMCSSSGTSTAIDAIWSITLGPGAISGNLTVNTTTPTYDMYIALMQGTCADTSACPREADSNPAGQSETIDLTGLAAGQYFLAVTSFTTGQCGSVTLDLPTLPVTLQGFSVE
ncbi:MAG TPA: hypothetical protein VFN25_11170 [Dokdonella sp.]|uniref:hypothetical protein n=1 Tax=Dokdonella sp. TaxID=2291710 RepID=UPI002D7F5559|nr:hypothetical protein [Dokdonella sp.]HET9033453.1 hypothetical protein [Dokdonella sp.]